VSSWGDIDAEFYVDDDSTRALLAKHLADSVESRDGGCPTGSESGPSVVDRGAARNGEGTNSVWVAGSLRDMHDDDSHRVLAWFVDTCKDPAYGPPYYATLQWEIQGDGPRYRFKWEAGELVRVKGALDV
jgi:hypothetical protein